MQYIPLVKPTDLAVKNSGKSIVLRLFKKYEFEMRKDTLEELTTLAEFIIRVKHPTDWVTGGTSDIKHEEAMELWPKDEDPLMGVQ